jgi:hypothetical protein
MSSKHKRQHSRTISLEKLGQKKNVRENLTEEQIETLNEFIKKLEEEGLTPKERKFCDEACLCRYLRARDWNLNKSYKMLRDTLKWREEFKVEQITAEHVKEEAKTGKMFKRGHDALGRPTVYMTPQRENSKNYTKNLQLLVYTIERAIDSLPEGVEQMSWVIDFNGYSLSNAPPISVAMETLNILSNHYPERLGVAVMVDTPWIFGLFWKAVSPFIHPNTAKKIQFVSGQSEKEKLFSKLFDIHSIEKRFGGKDDFEWNFDKIWKDEIEQDQKRLKKFNITPLTDEKQFA